MLPKPKHEVANWRRYRVYPGEETPDEPGAGLYFSTGDQIHGPYLSMQDLDAAMEKEANWSGDWQA